MYARRLSCFKGWKIIDLAGERAHVIEPLRGRTINRVQAVGKLLFVYFNAVDQLLRIHCLMFGDIRFDEIRPGKRMTLELTVCYGQRRANVRVYLGSTRLATMAEVDPTVVRRDITGGRQPTLRLMRRLKTSQPQSLICDALLDQAWFPGLGNKIRNEALFRSRLHPEHRLSDLADDQLQELASSIRNFTKHFESRVTEANDRPQLDYQIFRKRRCARCGSDVRNEVLGKLQRHCHYCPVCQS